MVYLWDRLVLLNDYASDGVDLINTVRASARFQKWNIVSGASDYRRLSQNDCVHVGCDGNTSFTRKQVLTIGSAGGKMGTMCRYVRRPCRSRSGDGVCCCCCWSRRGDSTTLSCCAAAAIIGIHIGRRRACVSSATQLVSAMMPPQVRS